MHQPIPRIHLGIALRGIANSALDVSDGLLGDLRHILQQSGKDAEIYLEQIPKSRTLRKQSPARRLRMLSISTILIPTVMA
jgi:thiamine-monophosphate kinase